MGDLAAAAGRGSAAPLGRGGDGSAGAGRDGHDAAARPAYEASEGRARPEAAVTILLQSAPDARIVLKRQTPRRIPRRLFPNSGGTRDDGRREQPFRFANDTVRNRVAPFHPKTGPRSRHPQKKGAARPSAPNRMASPGSLPVLRRSPKATVRGSGARPSVTLPTGPLHLSGGIASLHVKSVPAISRSRGARKPTATPNSEGRYRGLSGAVRLGLSLPTRRRTWRAAAVERETIGGAK